MQQDHGAYKIEYNLCYKKLKVFYNTKNEKIKIKNIAKKEGKQKNEGATYTTMQECVLVMNMYGDMVETEALVKRKNK